MPVYHFHRRIKLTTGILTFLSLFLFQISEGQRFLPDTIYVNFHADSLLPLTGISITEIIDSRNEDPRFVRYGTKTKFLLFPVDQEVYTTSPLADEIGKHILSDSSEGPEYTLEIQKFEIEKEKGRISSTTFLNTDLSLYEKHKDSLVYKGTFYYDYLYRRQAKKETLTEETENLLSKWHSDFKLDLITSKAKYTGQEKQVYTNFMVDNKIKSLYLNTSVAAFYGLNWWGLQGEVFFTRPETRSRNHYWAGIVRYNNNNDYESFAIGRKSEHYYFRKNENWLFDVDLNILIGFCKWKDVDEQNVKLYQVLDFELSSIQSIQYNPINSKGVFLRAGITENFLYVIEKKPKFQVGIFLAFGMKF